MRCSAAAKFGFCLWHEEKSSGATLMPQYTERETVEHNSWYQESGQYTTSAVLKFRLAPRAPQCDGARSLGGQKVLARSV
jgi:hypothetical protein